MNSNFLEKFQTVVPKHLKDDFLVHFQRLAASMSNESPNLKKHEVLKLGMYSVPLSKIPHQGDFIIDEIDGLPVIWISALGAYAVKFDSEVFVINICHPYRQKELRDARVLHS